jgi:hypothetical protein
MPRPTRLLVLPHNNREKSHDVDPAVRRTEYLTLPCPMPALALVVIDETGSPLAISTPGGRVRPEDLPQVWRAISEYNADCRAHDDCSVAESEGS